MYYCLSTLGLWLFLIRMCYCCKASKLGVPVNDLHRMIDANTNRASEGLRVLEDIARFSLNDPALSKRLKSLRHHLRSEISGLGFGQADILASRDTRSDVGTSISTPDEADRAAGLQDLASAASKRAQEALRVIEESSKALGHSGAGFERIRYAVYDIERDVVLGLSNPACDWSVCVLLTRSLCVHHSPERVVEEAARAGAGCIQIREKDMETDELIEHASTMTRLCRDRGIQIIINDRVDIAHACDADGVHLGRRDLPIAAARSILGPTKLIGKSCASIEQLKNAFDQGADYCGLGPVFESSTKSKPTLIGIDMLERVMSDPDLSIKPMLAISGITRENIDQVASVGFPGVAVSSAVCCAEDPYESCRAIVESMGPFARSH